MVPYLRPALKAFESRPVQNAAQALQGEVPGLTITRAGGAPVRT